MTRHNIKHIIYGFGMLGSLACGVSSCTEERFDMPDFTVSGKEVRIEIPVILPQMDKKTRADLDEVSLNRIESLWIRTYSSESGEATSDWVKQAPGSTDTERARSVTLDTKSGYSYIVGVANVNNSMGVTRLDPAAAPRPLSELLEEADTWQDFLNIAVVSPSNFANVNAPTPPLPMAGCYSSLAVGPHTTEPTNFKDWQIKNFTPSFIPYQEDTYVFKESDGAIHLRRLVSHINFNIKAATDDLKVDVNSYQVMNVPKFSWLYERKGDGVTLSNFADLATEETVQDFIADIPQFGSQYVTVDANGVSSFDYWQAESKHEGTSTTYAARDERAKEGSPLFTSLTGETWTPNNEASYVLINCTVDFTGYLDVNDQGVVTPGGTSVKRTAEVTYLVHLGYIGDNNISEVEKSKDFNCYRNVDYTYDITVNGINDIRVNAWAVDNYPGESGIISDLVNETIVLDAHYHAFNIQLTDAELSNPNFGILIATYKDGQQYLFDNKSSTELAAEGVPEELYNWVELRPTTSRDVLAEYKPRFGQYLSTTTFRLTDLAHGAAGMSGNMKSPSGWYTVFVNEYTYEPMYTGTAGYGNESGLGADGRPRWMSYVNQNPRRFYITTNRATSPDGQSIYARSKYGVSQRSMQSFYSDQIYPEEGTALGIERINESEGLNMRSENHGGSSPINGRWNCAQYLSGGNRNTQSISMGRWSSYIDQTAPLQIPGVSGLRAQNGPVLPDRTLASGNPVKMPKYANYTGTRMYYFFDPQESDIAEYYAEVMNACTNRNRDNNGNGTIDPEELRWYLPAMSTLVRMVVGDPALGQTPIMNFGQCEQLPMTTGSSWTDANGNINNAVTTRYLYSASNNSISSGSNDIDNIRILWGMEGLSVSTWQQWAYNSPGPAWQVRCVRNLGVDLTKITNVGTVQTAYEHNGTTRSITMKFYDNSAIRSNIYRGNGNSTGQMPIHITTSDYNKTYKAFEYYSTSISVGEKTSLSEIQNYINSNPCNRHGEDWRIPNQKELEFMREADVFKDYDSDSYHISCTFNYYNGTSGKGGQSDFIANPTQHLSMVTIPSNGTQARSWISKTYLRCVRDIEPNN